MAEGGGVGDECRLEQRERLGLLDDHPHVVVLTQRAQLDLGQGGACVAQHGERGLHRGDRIGMCGNVGFPGMPCHADRDAAQIWDQRARIVGYRPLRAGRVGRIVVCDRLQHHRHIADRPRHGADRVQAGRQRQHAASAHQAIGGL